MSTPPQHRFTIGQVMGLIAALALALALVANPGVARFLVFGLLPAALVVVVPVLLILHLIDGSLGVRCPSCGAPTMARRAVLSFGPRFFRCATCGIRCKRNMLGTWQDASGARYDHQFARKDVDDPWTAPPGLEDEDLIYSKTHVNLVRNKRNRRPENPNGPGLE